MNSWKKQYWTSKEILLIVVLFMICRTINQIVTLDLAFLSTYCVLFSKTWNSQMLIFDGFRVIVAYINILCIKVMLLFYM